jgi:hypothetical protein
VPLKRNVIFAPGSIVTHVGGTKFCPL